MDSMSSILNGPKLCHIYRPQFIVMFFFNGIANRTITLHGPMKFLLKFIRSVTVYNSAYQNEFHWHFMSSARISFIKIDQILKTNCTF